MWLVLVVAMGLGWWATNAKRLEAAAQAARLRSALTAAKPLVDAYCLSATAIYTGSPPPNYPDFSPLDEPLVEP
jgi:hypothetical protein